MTRLAPGYRIGPYEVVAPLGAGGMGEVWRARDTRLERDVALKVIGSGLLANDAARRRFHREALALAKLKHAHIAHIYDVVSEENVDALVMELVDGESLDDRLQRGPLPETEVVRLGLQLAEGLSTAHAEGVIHCDLKPANLKVTPKGELKVLDFGLAHFRRAAAAEALTAAATESATGFEVVGTLPYMAPEQLRAEPLDARTDIWAAGAVLCELATGQRPFGETVPTRLTDAILHFEPEALSAPASAVSADFRKILRKCLEKNPDGRYQTAAVLRADLEKLRAIAVPATARAGVGRGAGGRRRTAVTGGLLVLGIVALAALWRGGWPRGGTSGGRIDSLAVLPLSNISRNPEQEYFSDGMTEALIAELSKIRALKVISRTSVMQYKNAQKPLPEIARALGVKGIVEGSVMQEGGSVRITVQLIEADADRHLWAESYTREAKNVLALQSEVASAIAREVRVAVTPEEAQRLAAARPVDPEAHRLVLLGSYAMTQALTQRAGIEKGIEYFRKAVAADPGFALAHARFAGGLQWMGFAGYRPLREACAEARAEAEEALKLEPAQGEALGILVGLRRACDFDWAGAERDAKRALEVSPGAAQVHLEYSYLLSVLGRHDEAMREGRVAERLDPLSEQAGVYLGHRLFFARRFDEAIEQYRKVLSVHPESVFAKWSMANALVSLKLFDEAISTYLSRKVPRPDANFALGLAYGLSGRKAEARKVVDFLLEKRKADYVPASQIALVLAGLGEREAAFDWLKRSFDERGWLMDEVGVDPLYDVFRQDPRFPELLRRMNVPDAG